MANTVEQNRQGPIWVLGNIAVGTPGTPVGIMSLVDPTGKNDPNNPTSTTSNEYANRAWKISIQGCKAGASHGLAVNTGNIYVIKRGAGAGSGNRDDLGVIIAVIPAGSATVLPPIFTIEGAPDNKNVLNPYDIQIDADNAADGAQVVLTIQ